MSTAICCGTLFDGTADTVTTGTTLIVDGGRLHRGEAPPDAATVDLTDCFVMPGFVNAHAHLSVYGETESSLDTVSGVERRVLELGETLLMDLRTGTTTMRVLGETGWIDLYVRDAIAHGVLDGPELLVATRAIHPSAIGGEPDRVCDRVGDVRRIAGENLAHGADFIKVHATGNAEAGDVQLFTPAALRAAVEEAESAGSYVAAHAHGGPGVTAAVEAGVRTIEHGFYLNASDLEMMRERDCTLVCTYAFDLLPEGFARILSENDYPEPPGGLEAFLARVERHARLNMSSGARVALGTNHMRSRYMPEEILLAIRFGMTVAEALRAATADGAMALGVADEVGTLTPGKRADVIAFCGDPFHKPEILRNPTFVMKGGAIVKPRDTPSATA